MQKDTILLNFGYQGMSSSVDALVDRKDVIVYDSECHACIIDVRRTSKTICLSTTISKTSKTTKRAQRIIDETGGGILVITEGVFGMSGDLGKIDEISKLKEKYQFRLFVDDAHGFGTMGKTGYGTGEHLKCHEEIDIYFGTFAKSMAILEHSYPLLKTLSSTLDTTCVLRYLPNHCQCLL